ncbi:hypothetical protein pclt_cds_1007 [Pandoravirus celtis]|uniref:DUF2283 domain-containing protein n=1 Tax=Pandoravirus celtis TaxID=2568002 RepID=A0A4D6EJY2_9VIRU|nr:hypothetical protein pclt_cds_1007 [Pandoravirus celtis]
MLAVGGVAPPHPHTHTQCNPTVMREQDFRKKKTSEPKQRQRCLVFFLRCEKERKDMQQVKGTGTPLGSVAASVKVVGRGVDWDDMVLRYSPSVDAVVIDLTPAEHVIDNTVALDAPSDAFLDVDAAGKAVHIEFLDASSVFACHFYDRPGDVDGRGYVGFFFDFFHPPHKDPLPRRARLLRFHVSFFSHFFFLFHARAHHLAWGVPGDVRCRSCRDRRAMPLKKKMIKKSCARDRPLEWRARYESDRLTLSFVRDADQRAVAVADMDEGILMHTDDAGKIVALSIADATEIVHRRARPHS